MDLDNFSGDLVAEGEERQQMMMTMTMTLLQLLDSHRGDGGGNEASSGTDTHQFHPQQAGS